MLKSGFAKLKKKLKLAWPRKGFLTNASARLPLRGRHKPRLLRLKLRRPHKNKAMVFRREDLIVAILGAVKTRIRTPKVVHGLLQLGQLMQLLQRELARAHFKKIQLGFVDAYDPDSEKFAILLENDLQKLIDKGQVWAQKRYREEYDYSLTSAGEKRFQEQRYPAPILRILHRTKLWNRANSTLLSEYLRCTTD